MQKNLFLIYWETDISDWILPSSASILEKFPMWLTNDSAQTEQSAAILIRLGFMFFCFIISCACTMILFVYSEHLGL